MLSHKLKKISFIIISISFLISAPSALASGLVPCGPGSESGAPCKLCDLLVLANNLVDFVFGLSITLGIGFILYGGFVLLTAESSDRVKSGWSAIRNAIIGIAIVLGAWLIVDTTLRVFMGTDSPTNWGPWNTFPTCTASAILPSIISVNYEELNLYSHTNFKLQNS